MSAFPAAPVPTVSRLQRWTWRYPEAWVLVLVAAAWASMLAGVGHTHTTGDGNAVDRALAAWMAMATATMLPVVIPQMRRAALASFWHRRQRAIAGFVAGYLLLWCAAGCIAVVLFLPERMHHTTVPPLLFGLAAAWQMTAGYRSARRLCHKTMPLAPHGWQANRDCVRYGALVGWGCVRACFPLMLACAATGHGLVAMAGSCWLAILENWWARPSRRSLLIGTLALAAFYGVMSVLPSAHTSMRM